jgi:hypothetical protein
MRPAVLLTLDVEAGDAAKDVQPRGGVAADLDLRFDGSKRVECLVQQVAHHAGLGCVAGRPDVADREVVVDAHVALDEAGHLPVVGGAVVVFQNQDVAAAGRAGVALAPTLMVGVRQGGADGVTQGLGVAGLGGADAIRQTPFFHHASRRTA